MGLHVAETHHQGSKAKAAAHIRQALHEAPVRMVDTLSESVKCTRYICLRMTPQGTGTDLSAKCGPVSVPECTSCDNWVLQI